MNENMKTNTDLLLYEPPQLKVFLFSMEDTLQMSTNNASNNRALTENPYNNWGSGNDW